jgi:glutamine synthetase
MNSYDKNHITKLHQYIKNKKIKWIQLHFVDLFGKLRVLHIPISTFFNDELYNNGIGFDGSSVDFSEVDNSDLLAIPDLETLKIMPHILNEVIVYAKIYKKDLTRFPCDPRFILEKALEKANKNGYDNVKISPEMEFTLIPQNKNDTYEIEENNGYFYPSPLDNGQLFRKEVSELLIKYGYNIKYHHHENGKYQHEIELKSLNVINAADFCIFFKYLTREIALKNDFKVTFMPKPFSNESGNGMHVHLCLYKNNKNMFYNKNDKYLLSKVGKYFTSGVMKHAKSLSAIANPTINSYKRLIPNYEAPIYITWGPQNRSGLIRISLKKNIDIEIRNPDPSSNPYVLFAAIIFSGLDGIKNKIEYKPNEKNVYKMKEDEIKKLNIEKIPDNLKDALMELNKDKILKKLLGEQFCNLYIKEKEKEIKKYLLEISNLDYKYYFNS